MRTTVDIGDDVLLAVKERARREGRSAGSVLTELARFALTAHAPSSAAADADAAFFGFDPLPARGRVVSDILVERLRDEDGV